MSSERDIKFGRCHPIGKCCGGDSFDVFHKGKLVGKVLKDIQIHDFSGQTFSHFTWKPDDELRQWLTSTGKTFTAKDIQKAKQIVRSVYLLSKEGIL